MKSFELLLKFTPATFGFGLGQSYLLGVGWDYFLMKYCRLGQTNSDMLLNSMLLCCRFIVQISCPTVLLRLFSYWCIRCGMLIFKKCRILFVNLNKRKLCSLIKACCIVILMKCWLCIIYWSSLFFYFAG